MASPLFSGVARLRLLPVPCSVNLNSWEMSIYGQNDRVGPGLVLLVWSVQSWATPMLGSPSSPVSPTQGSMTPAWATVEVVIVDAGVWLWSDHKAKCLIWLWTIICHHLKHHYFDIKQSHQTSDQNYQNFFVVNKWPFRESENEADA